jgi:hypothetical protein
LLDRDKEISEFSNVKEKLASIDVDVLKAEECHQNISSSVVDSTHARFQDSMESIENRVNIFLD